MVPLITEEQREQYGNRTFARALYVYSAVIDKSEVVMGANEVHRTGRTVRDPIKWSVIAPDQQYADFAFDQRFRSEFRNSKPDSVTCEIFPVCSEITDMKER